MDFLDLLILDSGMPERAVAYARFGSDTAIELLPCGLITDLKAFRDRLFKAANSAGNRPTADELQSFGRSLFSFVLQNDLLAVYNRLPAQNVRIQVLSNQPDLQSLPWEYLQEPNSPAGPNNTRGIVRIIPTIGKSQPKPRRLKNKVRILFVYSDPSDQDPIAWSEIQATIEREFHSRLENNFEIDVIEGASIGDLTNALQAKSYDIFHFNGHGEIVKDPNGREIGQLLFVNPTTGKTQRLSAENLAVLMRGKGLQLVVLSACNSSAGDFAKSYAVIAKGLVDNGVPAVVANQFPVTVNCAATFAGGLYRSLLKTGDIDQAVADGRLVLAMQPTMGNQASLEWGIPTLYRHVGAAQLFTP